VIVLKRLVIDRWRTFLWWALGIFLYVLSNNAIYPSVKKVPGIEDMMKNMPQGLRNMLGSSELIPITSPAGYQQARLFALIVPLLLVIYAIGVGAYAIGGSEEDGTLELVLSNPVSRARVLFERYGAFVLLLGGLGAVATVSIVGLSPPFGLLDGVSVAGLLATCGAATFIGLLHGSIAFAVGAIAGRRAIGIAVATVVAVAGNLMNILSSSSESVRVLRLFTPWHWYGGRNMLAQGVALESLLLPLGLSALLAGLAYWVFGRRDLR
jgi:ABC-2 type transport system permease protein